MPDRDDRPGPDEPLTPLEARLLGWRPSPGGLDRDRMLFEAGRSGALAEARGRFWRGATAGLVLASIGLVVALIDARVDQGALRDELAAMKARGGVFDASVEPSWGTSSTPDPREIAAEPVAPPPIEPVALDASSYLAMTRRLVSLDGTLADRPDDPAPIGEPTGAGSASPTPLRAFGRGGPFDL
ncbi:hypothetical protein [Tautonia plasticadhaerens]|uniref:Uncharacterized protein n=1 Tax=Tautonia plasticadhaerens TaxID=2527974 RepID=A0A518HD31_9BACT|nr:hypothetical protein [Tautonia plasticadhaerens]QDV38768.1 hypothetical protein ElP_67250 [Tautonia plasticadhaerens]